MLITLVAKVARVFHPFGLSKIFVNLVCGKEKFFEVDTVYNPFSGKPEVRLGLNIPGRGCAWFKQSGGCTMCGFNRKLEAIHKEWNLSASDLVGLYKIADLLTRSKKPKILSVFNGGSLLNEDEIPLKTQLAIARMVRKHPTLEYLFIESRPEFITAERVSRVRDALGGKKMEIGIGLEAVTDRVREDYIRKGFNLVAYEKAVALLRSMGVYVFTYVFLKPLYLSEREAIEEAVKTTRYAFSVGSDEVSLSCAFVQEGTSMAEVYHQGKFKPPWLWSIIEVVRRTAHLGPVKIGSFNDNPLPIATPQNCPLCSKKALQAIEAYNNTRSISVFDNLGCSCQKEWREVIS